MMAVFRSFVLPILMGVIFLGLYIAHHLGMWSSVEIELLELPDRTVLFMEHQGAYHEIDGTLVSLEKWALDVGIDCSETFAEFFDDPNTVAEVDLKSRAGCVIQTADMSKLGTLSLLENSQKGLLHSGPHLIAKFPGSPAIAQIKVYPRLKEEADVRRLKTLGTVIHTYKLSPSGAFSSAYQQRVELPPP